MPRERLLHTQPFSCLYLLMFDTGLPINYLEHFSYLGVFVFLVLGGILSPISEEVVLLAVGYLIGVGVMNKFIALPVSIVGVFIGDSILFHLSGHGGYAKKFIAKMSQERLLKYEDFMKTHSHKAIFFLRFIVGLRFLGPMLAGVMKVKSNIFRLYDFLAVLIYVPVLIYIGYYFNDQLDVLTAKLTALKHGLFVTLTIVVVLTVSIAIQNKFLKNNHRPSRKR